MTTTSPVAATPPRELPPLTPGQKAWMTYAGTIMRLPGVMWVGQSSAEPNAFQVNFQTPELAQLGDAVLKDKVLDADVKILVGDDAATADAVAGAAATAPWQERSENALRAIAGLDGVWGYTQVPRPKVKFVQVHAVNQGYAEHLRDLVSRTLPDGTVINIRERPFPQNPPKTAAAPAT